MKRNDGQASQYIVSYGKQDNVESHKCSADVCSQEVLELSGVLGASSI